MGKFISVFYRYRPIRKLDLSAVIGIGRYGKKLIDRTLIWSECKKSRWSILLYIEWYLILKITFFLISVKYAKKFIRFSANLLVIVDHLITIVFKAQRKRKIRKNLFPGQIFTTNVTEIWYKKTPFFHNICCEKEI